MSKTIKCSLADATKAAFLGRPVRKFQNFMECDYACLRNGSCKYSGTQDECYEYEVQLEEMG